MAQKNYTTETIAMKPRLTETERGVIEGFLRCNKSISFIARELGRSRTTIYAEIKRGTTKQVQIINDKRVYKIGYLADCGMAVTKANVALSRNPKRFGRVNHQAR